ncbi:reverse transcriptase domain-containing protein [Tanacetum coccineum]
MPTWCHMFNSTLTGNARVWFDDLSPESWCHMFNSTLTENARVWFDELLKEIIDSYDDLKKAFLENNLQQNKCIKDPVEIHNIRQRDGESTEEFVRRITKSVDEMMRVTTAFLQGEKQCEEMLKAGKLSHLIKELKQNNGKEQPKVTKKGETSGKDKALAILMVQPWKGWLDKGLHRVSLLIQKSFFHPWGKMKERKAIQEEVGKLVEAGIMKEVHYHDWLSNPVMVKKHETSEDVPRNSNQNKAYQRTVIRYPGNRLERSDGRKNPIHHNGIFCYTKMPFGLRNAGATYQRLVDKAFYKQIGRNLEVYVDDLVIKSRTEDEIVRDIEETFKTLREINMKLNTKKCTFEVEEGMFLGYKVNSKGLKVCLDKVDDVLSLPSPKCLKDVQKLNGKLTSLNRFLAKSAKKSLPFFKTLKKCTKKSNFHWTTEAEEAFKKMKHLIAELPMLTAPMEKRRAYCLLGCSKRDSQRSLDDGKGS